ncbi:hypothetical protein D4R51_02920 [bacterium]|nr:MAG: hypothetical protein D4R51_02920 [bacterium]
MDMNKPIKAHHSKKYSINDRFFDSWSVPMAYVLGFWFADGYMRKEKSYRIVVVSNDSDILEDIRTKMGSTHPIKKRRGDRSYSITIHSKYLYNALTRRGGFRRKSRTMIFPAVPKKYLRDYIRGYFDGDGSVFFVTYARTKDKKITRELRTNFTSGSRKFLESLMKILYIELNLSLKKLGVFNNGSSLKLGYGMKDSDTLLKYMYYNNFTIGLKRKADFVNRIPSYQKHNLSK